MGWKLWRAREAGEDAAAPPGGIDPRGLGQALFDSLPQAVLFVDERDHIRVVNAACRKFFPGDGDWIGRPLLSVVLDHRIARAVERARTSRQAQRALLASPAAQVDAGLWWEVDAEQVGVGAEQWVRLLVRDETERQQLEQIRRDFVANASHELRTPLTILHGNLENLLDGGLENPEFARRFVGSALGHSQRLGRLVEDMLVLSRIEYRGGEGAAHDLGPRQERFDLGQVLGEVCERLEPMRAEHAARVISALDPTLKHLPGDAFYWEQILYNLIENALKNNAGHPSLEIRVEAGWRAAGQGKTPGDAGTAEHDGWWLEVVDNGIGIPRADLPFIFKRFYRVQKDHGPRLRGTGLGLSIVRRAVEAHGGEITVTSEPGRRTCFRIEVGVAAGPPAGGASARCSDSPPEASDAKP